jgi:pyruvate/2-oxoglutarate dehydrogenase complex dihydrolipoamide acyltransferase (E2) component
MARRETVKIVADADFSTDYRRIPAEEFDPDEHERFDPNAKLAEVDVTSGAEELAEAEGVDLSALEGSGKDGRITKADVKSAI